MSCYTIDSFKCFDKNNFCNICTENRFDSTITSNGRTCSYSDCREKKEHQVLNYYWVVCAIALVFLWRRKKNLKSNSSKSSSVNRCRTGKRGFKSLPLHFYVYSTCGHKSIILFGDYPFVYFF
jgi:hypothetical protein